MARHSLAILWFALLVCSASLLLSQGIPFPGPGLPSAGGGGGGGGPVAKGTAVAGVRDPASTTVVSAAWTAAANSLLLCHVVTDDNGSGTTVSGIVVSGSPGYSTAWAQVATNGYLLDSGQVSSSLWRAVTSSGFTGQTATATYSSTERATILCQSYSGIDTSNPLPASANAKALTVNVASSSNNNSLYAGFYGCGTNQATNLGSAISAGTGYTVDASANMTGTTNQWVHGALETKNAAVDPAATTTVNFATDGAVCGTGAGFFQLIAVEIKVSP